MEGTQSVETVARRLALLVLLAIAFTASAMLTIYLLFRSGEVRVPNTIGMSQEEAHRAIQRAGLGVKLRRQHFDAEVPQGTVSEQDPVAGFPVKEGFEVKIDISKGPDPSGKADEPPPPGPTNPVDGPKQEDEDAAEKRKKKREAEKKAAEAKAAEEAKAAAAGDEPGAAKATDKPKPKPAGEAPKPGETAKPKNGGAAKPDAPKPKPAPPKPPPSR